MKSKVGKLRQDQRQIKDKFNMLQQSNEKIKGDIIKSHQEIQCHLESATDCCHHDCFNLSIYSCCSLSIRILIQLYCSLLI